MFLAAFILLHIRRVDGFTHEFLLLSLKLRALTIDVTLRPFYCAIILSHLFYPQTQYDSRIHRLTI